MCPSSVVVPSPSFASLSLLSHSLLEALREHLPLQPRAWWSRVRPPARTNWDLDIRSEYPGLRTLALVDRGLVAETEMSPERVLPGWGQASMA